MADTKREMTDALEQLVKEEFKQFKWQLWNPMTDDIEPIPQSRLQDADRYDVVDLMVRQYSEEAGNVAVKALRKMKQNEVSKKLERKLQEAQQLEQVDGRNASVSGSQQQLIQSDWKRPGGIKPCTQEFKNKILRENGDEIYIPMEKSQRKRSALLITNIEFKHLTYRHGAKEDEKNMEWLLTALGYSVEKDRNLSGQKIDAKVKKFAEPSNHKDSDSTFVVIMSHGGRIANKDAILGVNYHEGLNPDDVFFVDDIFSHLNSEKCPTLINKPKVILIQACRGGDPGGVVAQSDAAVHREKDFVCFKSCLPDISAYRDPVNGSFFMMHIVQVFCERACVDDIMELFRKVTSYMEKDPRFTPLVEKLMPCLDRTSLPKKFYLFPGL